MVNVERAALCANFALHTTRQQIPDMNYQLIQALKVLAVALIISLLSNSVFGQSQNTVRVMPYAKMQVRDGIIYMPNEQSPYTGVIKGETLKGESIQFEVKNGRGNGEQVAWHSNGQIALEGMLKDGQDHGVLKNWNSNGVLTKEATYNSGQPTGVHKEWYDSGVGMSIERFVDGQLHGEQVYYHSSGGLRRKTTYVRGIKNGVDQGWYENGNPEWKEHYVKGVTNGVSTRWHENGSIYQQGPYSNGVPVDLHIANVGPGRVLRECFVEGESVFLGYCMSQDDTKDTVTEVVGIPLFTEIQTQGETWHYCQRSTDFFKQTYYLIKFDEEVFTGITEETIEQFMLDCNERYSESRS